MALGAGAADLGSYQGHGSFCLPQGLQVTWAVLMLGGFQVNLEGQRFADESRGYSEHAEDVLRQPGGVAWDIYDARCEVPALAFHDYRDLQRLGGIRQADTIAELARATGLPADALARTFAEVESFAAGRQADPLRRDFTQVPPLAPPYRAARVTGALLHTQGGLSIDGDAQVLRPNGSKLPNLFAGGGAARGLSGPSGWGYLSGNGLLSAVVLGRLAGLSAARLVVPKAG
jgi:fumarate reductase flavoprotein subunit